MPTPTTEHADTAGSRPVSDANRLGIDFLKEADRFAYDGPIIDIHTHVSSPRAAELYLDTCDAFGIERAYTMTGIDHARQVRDSLTCDRAGRIRFICVPDFTKRDEPDTFTTKWLDDIEAFYEMGSRIIKFWCGPRGLDFDDSPESPMRLGSPIRRRGIQLAYDLGYRLFMTHVADPDTWFQTAYADSDKYGTKLEQYKPLEELLAQYRDVTWIGAHMGGYPEDLDWLQAFLDRHPNYVVDTSATKWQVRELSKHPDRFRQFVEDNPGRVLFGSDIVAWPTNTDPDPDNPDAGHGRELYASRYWALRTLMETDYDGPSPIVDPDLNKVDPTADPKSTATLRGAILSPKRLQDVYYDAARAVLERGGAW
ncbi:MAG: amidohydrolase family protein [Phycisphaeraceae bacterium]